MTWTVFATNLEVDAASFCALTFKILPWIIWSEWWVSLHGIALLKRRHGLSSSISVRNTWPSIVSNDVCKVVEAAACIPAWALSFKRAWSPVHARQRTCMISSLAGSHLSHSPVRTVTCIRLTIRWAPWATSRSTRVSALYSIVRWDAAKRLVLLLLLYDLATFESDHSVDLRIRLLLEGQYFVHLKGHSALSI